MNLLYQKISQQKILFAVSALLIIYEILRACNVSLTHDEALTYNLVKDHDYFGYTANNHLLNTWLMAFFTSIFGESEFVLRLPSLLLFSIYIFFCCSLLLKYEKIVYIFFAIPLLFLNPFVLDFFALARGYGISMGFIAGSLYYLLRTNYSEQTPVSLTKDFTASMLFAAGALLSNLSLINFYIALLVLFCGNYFLILLKNKTERKVLRFIIILFFACIPLFFSLKRLMVLKEANDLYVGASSFDEAVATFIERSSYLVPYSIWFIELLQSFIIYIFPVGLIITLLRKNYDGPLFKLGLLLTLMLVGFEAEHFLFLTLFPIGRTGVYFIPLFGFFLYYLFIQFVENRKASQQKGFLAAGFIIVSLPLCFHFFRTMNLSYTFEWKYDKHTKEVVMALEDKSKPIVLGHNWIFGPTINYYIRSRNLAMKAVKLEGNPYYQDFVYEFKDQFEDSSWISVKKFEDTETAIYKPN